MAMVPSAALPPAIPFTSQVSAVAGVTHSVAVKTCAPPEVTFADDGAIEFTAGQETVTLADADFVGSATFVAAIVTALPGGMAGAVYVAVFDPVALSVSLVVSPPLVTPLVPLMLQLTAEFALPLTDAVKCCVPPGGTFAAPGATFTVIPL